MIRYSLLSMLAATVFILASCSTSKESKIGKHKNKVEKLNASDSLQMGLKHSVEEKLLKKYKEEKL